MEFLIPAWVKTYMTMIDIALNIFAIFCKILIYLIDNLSNIVMYFLTFINDYLSTFNQHLAEFNTSWINPQVQSLPSSLLTSMEIINGVFPLDTFFQTVIIIVLLWSWALIVKALLRVITLGQA